MKKIFSSLILVAAVSISLISCRENENHEADDLSTENGAEVKVKNDGDKIKIKTDDKKVKITTDDDGTVTKKVKVD